MPNIMNILGYRVYFWSNEGIPTEPIHVHVSQRPHENATKIWIMSTGKCEIESNNDQIPDHILKRILRSVEDFSPEIIKQWMERFQVLEYIDQKIL